MSTIKSVKGREILDSRGNPTVEVEVILSSGARGLAAVPSGASTGEFEALELRDNDKKRYLGKGVLKAVENVNTVIAKAVKGKKPEFRKVDALMRELDGTGSKSRLGANAILGVSLAVAKAAAAEKKQPLYAYIGKDKARILPVPLMNILNGGVHADSGLDIQEFMIVPFGFDTFRRALQAGAEVFHHLKKILKSENHSVSVGDEGGFAPRLSSNTQALEYILKAITGAGYSPEKEVGLALDAAASSFFKAGKYWFEKEGRDAGYLIDYYEGICARYPILSIEDGLDENDWSNWRKLTERLGKKIQLVGDDIFVTNSKLLQRGIDQGVANSILIKVNQIGSLSETLDTIALALKNKYTCVISHRSGETEDTTIAHLAVGVGAGQIKTGSLSRTDRIAKYNELLRIEEALGKRAVYAGKNFAKKHA